MDFVPYVAKRSPFMRWFVPISFSVIAVLAAWNDQRWSWLNIVFGIFALAEWVRFAQWRKELRLQRMLKDLGVAKA